MTNVDRLNVDRLMAATTAVHCETNSILVLRRSCLVTSWLVTACTQSAVVQPLRHVHGKAYDGLCTCSRAAPKGLSHDNATTHATTMQPPCNGHATCPKAHDARRTCGVDGISVVAASLLVVPNHFGLSSGPNNIIYYYLQLRTK